MFLMIDQIHFESYADDNTPYTENENIDQVIRIIEDTSIPLLKWFKDKIKINRDKYYLLLIGNDDRSVNVGNCVIKN